ncbi:MAG: anaerobic ribonucleoside-triphosphate reductase activating protein [Desulfobacterales bacterium]|jgi:pyruvate formate lyase activating enzyme
MIIGGWQKVSLIDYPGRISCILFVSGCNFSCPYCHNPQLAKGGRLRSFFIDGQTVYDYLEGCKGFIDGVVISGGEPTIWQDLVSLCKKVKRIGYPIKLDTNGSRPQILKQLIEEDLIDYIAMDIKTDPFHYSPFIKNGQNPYHILSSIQIIMESAIAHEFRTTCVKPFVDARVIRKIAEIIDGAMLYVLQPFNNSIVLQPEFFKATNPGYEDAELMVLKSLAEPWVQSCIIR